MKTLFAALAALTMTAGVASAADLGQRIPGHIFVKADVDNDGVLNKGELRRADTLNRWNNRGDN